MCGDAIAVQLSAEFDRASQAASRELRDQLSAAEQKAMQAEGKAKQQARELSVVSLRYVVVPSCDEKRANMCFLFSFLSFLFFVGIYGKKTSPRRSEAASDRLNPIAPN